MKKLLLLLSLSILVYSCTKPIPDLEITSATSLAFSKKGGSQNISMTAYSDWTAKCDAGWVTLSPASGTAGTDGVPSTIKVIVKENTEYDDRTGTISITSNGKIFTVTVTQATQTAIILSEPEQTVDFHACDVAVKGQANVAISVDIPSSCTWVSYNPSKALSDFTYTLNVQENPNSSAREVTITFSNSDTDDSDSFTITQEGKPQILSCSIPGLYQGKTLVYGYDDTKQLGVLNRNGSNEFHIVNANTRKFCIFCGIPSITEGKLPSEAFPVTVSQNTVKGYEKNFTMNIKALEYEDGMLWGVEKSTDRGVILMLK